MGGMLFPSAAIELSDDRFEIFEITINPVLLVEDRKLLGVVSGRLLALPPRRRFEVWIELVLGHHQSQPLALPDVTFVFDNGMHLVDHSFLHQEAGDPYGRRGTPNYQLYSHFWLEETVPRARSAKRDLIREAYGQDAQRLIHPEHRLQDADLQDVLDRLNSERKVLTDTRARFGLTFLRSPYGSTSRISGRPPRVNYPCTYWVSSPGEDRVTVTPLPFAVENWEPSTTPEWLDRQESLSFWFHYPYDEVTAANASAPSYDLFAFVHKISLPRVCCAQGISLNMFPRLSRRYRVEHSDPPLVISPRLERDPPPWTRGVEGTYPLAREALFIDDEPRRSSKDGDCRKSHASSARSRVERLRRSRLSRPSEVLNYWEIPIFISLRDDKTPVDRGVSVVCHTLVVGISMNFVANHATAGVQEGPPALWFFVTSVLVGMSSVALTWVFRGQVTGLFELFSAGYRDDMSSSERIPARIEAAVLLLGILCLTPLLWWLLDAIKADLLGRALFFLLAFFAGTLFMFFLGLIAEEKPQ